MYTEKSVDLKKDFYARYGNAQGMLHFAKTGVACTVLDADVGKLMFPLDCGVRAYGRCYGDILRVMNTQTDVCDVHFTQEGKGAQILYRKDIEDLRGMDAAARYTVNKILEMGGSLLYEEKNYDDVEICDIYAPEGWCAVKMFDEIKTVPLPLMGYGIVLIRSRKHSVRAGEEKRKQFNLAEKERIRVAFAGLKECKLEVLFDMINESEKSIERLFSLNSELRATVRATHGIAGIDAVRICDIGVVCFVRNDNIDSIINTLKRECERYLGYNVRISMVK